ncbi:MAG: nucleotide sugar dehydrogenase [Gammaproteobacteria bacterium]|nr:nucleotide sugar dehydrogenase [Gammaproteobacteria bacterium]
MKNKKIALIGLGYVGLPLAVAFAEKFKVVGFDISSSRIQELGSGHDTTLEIEDDLLQSVRSNITYTSSIQDIKDCNDYIITVPTPIDSTNCPDLTPLIESSKTVGAVLSQNDIVIYESTVYPGATEDVCVPELENSSGLTYNQGFFCGYSPERINPGDKEHTVTKIPKVTSGSTKEIAKQVDDLYKQVIVAGTYLASSIKVAEASKVIENTQRDVNIALINELALICNQIGIDTNEVIEAASTKWNFIKLTPGLVGGHCIGIDPYYLSFKSEEVGHKPDLILAARKINNGMSKYITDQTVREMIKAGKVIKNSNILILGLTFKENCPDMRNTKVIDIIEELKNLGANVHIYDPWVDPERERNKYSIIENPLESSKQYDAIVVAVGHEQFKAYTNNDYSRLSNGESVLIDVKNVIKNPTWRL